MLQSVQIARLFLVYKVDLAIYLHEFWIGAEGPIREKIMGKGVNSSCACSEIGETMNGH